jgi:hypothetical protein
VSAKSERFYSSKTHFIPDSSYSFSGQQINVEIAPLTFYEPVKKFGDIQNNRIDGGEITIQKSFKVRMTPLKNTDLNKQYIQVLSKGKPTALITTNDKQKLTAESKFFGQFAVKIDTIAPIIKPNNFKEVDSVIHSRSLIWKVSDGQTDISNYNILVNGEWQPLEYDLKTNRLIFIKPDSQLKTATFEVLVSDNCGNIASWKKKLYFD